MGDLVSFFSNPLFWKVIVGYWVFSAAVDSMPSATEKSSPFYAFAFRFLHTLAGNAKRAAQTFKVPGVEGEPK